MTETANNILGKHRPTKKPWVADNIPKLCDKRRELKQKKNTTEGEKLYREANQQVKRRGSRHGLKNNAKVLKKTCRKQQQESLPACERTDKLKTRENYYHPWQSREMSHRRTRHLVRESKGPTVHPPPPPSPTGTFHYGPKMYLRVSRSQLHLFPGQPMGCTGVTALYARVPSWVQPVADWVQVTNVLFKLLFCDIMAQI